MLVMTTPTWCIPVQRAIDLSNDGHVNSVFSSGLVGVPV